MNQDAEIIHYVKCLRCGSHNKHTYSPLMWHLSPFNRLSKHHKLSFSIRITVQIKSTKVLKHPNCQFPLARYVNIKGFCSTIFTNVHSGYKMLKFGF